MNDRYGDEQKRNESWSADIALSRLDPSLEGEILPMQLSEDFIHEVDEFLTQNEVHSPEELDLIIQKLDMASAINNDPKAKELRIELFRKFGK